MELERPEDEPLPGDWKRMSDFDQLLLFRALRPDRLTSAMSRFCATVIDPAFTRSVPFDLERSYGVSTA
jgi:dynein heavy chain, axonemal